MTDKELIKTVKGFRKGLLGSQSVKSMCYKVSLPLCSFLRCIHVRCEILEVGITQGSDIHSHYCIQLHDGRILDATASQFADPDGKQMPDIYLGERPNWYQKIKNSKHSEVPKKGKQ